MCCDRHKQPVNADFSLFLSPKPMEFAAQVNAMQHLREQLEQRTMLIQANIHRQQEELRLIQEQLQKVQGQGIQVGMTWATQELCPVFPISASLGFLTQFVYQVYLKPFFFFR